MITKHIFRITMKREKDQVKLLKLIFTLNWEDPEMDRMALKINPKLDGVENES